MLELASILVLGIFSQWLAWRIKQPAILPLILIGLLIGPFSTLITADGSKLINGDEIFTGDLLFSFVSIAVGVILFEGGLTLNVKELKTLGSTVRNLLLIGALVTFVGGGLASHYIMGLSWEISFLFGALIIVSGPTVITPILRNVRPNANVNTVLKWESILIDPLGALVAVLMYEFILSSKHTGYRMEVFQEFFITTSAGIVMGAFGAFFLFYLLKKNALPEYLKNVFTLGLVIFTFSFSELIHAEAGLMASVVMGVILANMRLEEIKKILSFKEDISIILISILFILLSSRIDLVQIEKLGLASMLLFAVVIFLIRPVGVILSSWGSNLKWNEIAFISWIGPRGIVAAAVASLFTLDLLRNNSHVATAEAELLLPLVFLIIVGTVILQGSTAKFVGEKLGVIRKEPNGILIVGANELARKIGAMFDSHGVYVKFVDTSAPNIRDAKKMGLRAVEFNVLSDEIFDVIDFTRVGKIMALTSNPGLNELVCKFFDKELGEENTYRVASKEESENPNLPVPKNVLFHASSDFVGMVHLLRTGKRIAEFKYESTDQVEEFIEHNQHSIVPLFFMGSENRYELVSGFPMNKERNDVLVFLKKANFEEPETEE